MSTKKLDINCGKLKSSKKKVSLGLFLDDHFTIACKDKSIRMSFRSKGKDVFVGDFLNEDDKILLKDSVTEIINELNQI